jgi:putative ABC transport system permease protein
MLKSFLRDLFFAAHSLGRQKGFCGLAIGILAVGIAAVTTQYAVLSGVLLHTFPFRDAGRLVGVQVVDPKAPPAEQADTRIPLADFLEVRDRQKSFESFVGYADRLTTVTLTYRNQPKRLSGTYVTHDFFPALGVAPALGRTFLPEDDRPGVAKAVLLSDTLWRQDFAADPGVIGTGVRVNGGAGVIVGVMPPGFTFPFSEQVWLPVNAEFSAERRVPHTPVGMAVVARLHPGVTPAQAGAEITALAGQLGEAYPETNRRLSLGRVQPLIGTFTGERFPSLLHLLFGFCIGVLLIACLNVMNMLFVRATVRARELAIRSALGATRGRLVSQMLAESLLIAGPAAVIGSVLSLWAIDRLNLVVHNWEYALPDWMRFEMDAGVLLCVIVVTLLAALVSGLLPAWLASRTDAADGLRAGGRGQTGGAFGAITKALVVFQIVATSLLLTGALLQVNSLFKAQSVDYGYDTSGVLGARIGLMEARYPTPRLRAAFYERLQRELRATPALAAVGFTSRYRMMLAGDTTLEIEGRTYAGEGDRPTVHYENVSPGYFDALGARIGQGRDFNDVDSDRRLPVAIVNAAFARRHFGTASALGRRFRTTEPNGANPGPWRTIVGEVPTLRMQSPLSEGDDSGFYVPFFSSAVGPASLDPTAPQFGTVIARPPAGQRPETLAGPLQAAVGRIDPDLPLYYVSTPQVAHGIFLAQDRMIAALLGLFGVVALSLASVGLYGITSFTVSQRTREFGVRLALGADRRRIFRLVLGQASRQLALGLLIGQGLALALATFFATEIRGRLYQVSPGDPVVFTTVAALLSLVSFAATFVPARRATRVDPMVALRAE